MRNGQNANLVRKPEVVKEIELDGLDADDKAAALAQLGQVRKRLKNVAGNAQALNALSQCGNAQLKPVLLKREAEELMANATALLQAIEELPVAC